MRWPPNQYQTRNVFALLSSAVNCGRRERQLFRRCGIFSKTSTYVGSSRYNDPRTSVRQWLQPKWSVSFFVCLINLVSMAHKPLGPKRNWRPISTVFETMKSSLFNEIYKLRKQTVGCLLNMVPLHTKQSELSSVTKLFYRKPIDS